MPRVNVESVVGAIANVARGIGDSHALETSEDIIMAASQRPAFICPADEQPATSKREMQG